ncbi:MAG TPA: DUF4010 domain-containing protein [Beijerinckia sp.]|jgi:uncharacterized membrane protein (DUF4010 family)|nr:DUF4010 domain-containing protein [Beijerinckia sp.]
MFAVDPVIKNLAIALGIGLLIGAERERRKGEAPARSAAGLRTFTITSLAGAVSFIVGKEYLLAVAIGGIVVLTALAYWRGQQDDPDLTTEIALILTALLGGLAMTEPPLAAGLAVAVTILLGARMALHEFVRTVLSEDEVRDGLIFAAATLIVLPLLPDQRMGPYGALNPRSIWIVVILVMAISASGYVAVRLLGARFGLPLAGLASGFISSTITIGSMGTRSRNAPDELGPAAAGAILSTVATIVQMALVLAATNMATLRALWPPLALAGIAALAYGAIFSAHALKQSPEEVSEPGRAFSPKTSLLFAATVSAVLLISRMLYEWFGTAGAIAAAAITGFADTHSAAISMASLAASGKISAQESVLPILLGLSTNTLSKFAFAILGGGRAFALRVVPGLALVILAAWAGFALSPTINH